MVQNEFSAAYSTAFDAEDTATFGVCHPDSTDWACAYTPEEIAELDPVVKDRAETLAWTSLATLTGYQVATCPVTVRPCALGCSRQTYQAWPQLSAGVGPFRPGINNQGYWINGCGCGSPGSCSCTSLSEVDLPGPVGGIVEVWLDGQILPPSAYRVDNTHLLVRTDGQDWPGCQDMNAAWNEDGAFAVTYWQGFPPNSLTNYAAGVLAAEFYKACGGGKCRLPAGVTSVTRQGVTLEIQTGLWQAGWTGIREVDAVIATFNPYGLRSPSVITSPDVVAPRRTTWRW